MENIFGKNLRFLRERKGLKLAEIPDFIGFSGSQWNNWELGTSFPKFMDLIQISKQFEVSETDLLHIDLQNVQVIQKEGEDKNTENVQGNVQASVQATPKNQLRDHDPPYQAQETKIVPVVVTIDSHGRDNITLVPVKARAGYLLGYGDPQYIKKLPVYRLPGLNNGTFRAFEVEGLSMYNTFSPGDIVIGSYVELAQHCRDERVYIFVTKDDGILIKRAINRAEKEGKFILKSDNITDRDQYPVTVLPVDKIAEIWYVEAVLSKNLRAPSSIYGRLTDLEARMAILEDSGHKKGAKSKLK